MKKRVIGGHQAWLGSGGADQMQCGCAGVRTETWSLPLTKAGLVQARIQQPLELESSEPRLVLVSLSNLSCAYGVISMQ